MWIVYCIKLLIDFWYKLFGKGVANRSVVNGDIFFIKVVSNIYGIMILIIMNIVFIGK